MMGVTPPLFKTTSTSTTFSEASLVLELSRARFVTAWLALLMVRCVAAAYLASMASLHVLLSRPSMSYYARLLGAEATPLLLPMAAGFGLLAVAHSVKIATMLRHSLAARALVFDSTAAMAVGTRGTRPRMSILAGASLWRLVRLRVARAWYQCFGRRGFFGVESAYFTLRFTMREAFEIVSQTLQLRTSTRLIARQWTNDVFAAIVVVNAWSTPLVQFACRRGLRRRGLSAEALERGVRSALARERLLCLAIDLSLDLLTAVALPTVLLLPYARQFDAQAMGFPSTLLYSDLWFVSFVYEFQQVLAVTAVETAFTLFPHWSIFSCCDSIATLLLLSTSTPAASTAAIKRKASIVPGQPPAVATTGPPRVLARSNNRPSTRRQRSLAFLRRMTVSSVVHVAFFAWGLAILALHLDARRVAHRTHSIACKQELRPWLSTQRACSVVVFNCHRAGVDSIRDSDLEQLDTHSLAVLAVAHCPALVMPAALQRFDHLLGIEVFNSTLVAWPWPLLPDVHASLVYVMLAATNMTRFPDGLATPLPRNLIDIEVVYSNLSTLPENLHELWHPMAVLYLEHAGFTRVPQTLERLIVSELSLCGNPLTELPTEPLARGALTRLSVQHTRLAALPPWALGSNALRVFARGTPLCSGADATATLDACRFEEDTIDHADEDDRSCGHVPFELLALRRPW
ncbi:hypothetical protein PINS_up010745 [Pythium insidiosum]|nr:hypothetical protein PINS_up010745 [Pythium insidiosum]